ncbi:metallophosphoesterase family protein [Bacillus canaveralius]|uniref:metallophosphoesterase family protein n=1 Tax=Bacillus canaveralius TaxID=1403243 RepID=UPI0015E15B48|nr:metallophosphoesterase family protein [Bacillus canaveralius]
MEELDKLHTNEKTNLVLFGHVHHAFTRQANGRTIVNAGSAGFSFDGDNRASYAIIDIDQTNLAVQFKKGVL